MKNLSTYMQQSLKEQEIMDSVKSIITSISEFSCVKEYQYPDSFKSADIMVLYNKEPYASIEVKTNLRHTRVQELGKQQLEYGRDRLLMRFGVLTDGSYSILYDWWKDGSEQEIKNKTLKQIIDYIYDERDKTIIQVYSENTSKPDKEKYDINTYKEIFCKIFNEIFPEKKILITDVEIENGKTIKLKEDVENDLFDKLFPLLEENEVCRFTSLSAVFASIENNSYRMVATDGMNDTEDGTFLWKKLYGDKAKDKLLPLKKETIFILSCSPTKSISDLTMWRLYADDTRGVCLEFDVKTIDANKGFFLRKVSYEEDNSNNILVRLTQLIKKFQEESNGFIFVFNNWDLWRAFIKSKEYKVEQEIRLAFIPSKYGTRKPEIKWLMTKSNHIISEYVDFKENQNLPFPLQLKNIWLGAACPEKNINKLQLKKMIESIDGFKDKNIEVEVSIIDNYRPSK